MARDDPYKSYNFRVEIDGIAVAAFCEVSGLRNETEVIAYRTGGEPTTVRKLPGLTTHADLVLRRGQTNPDRFSAPRSVTECHLHHERE